MRIRELHCETWVDHDKSTVFDFFRQPSNLIEITPPSFSIELLNDNVIELQEDTILDLRMKILGFIPVSWQTKISEWQPPDYFVDTQPKGPYRHWKHTHRFKEKDDGTLIIDHVEYAVPGFIFEPIIHRLFVRRDLEDLFDYRQSKYAELIGT